jgi:outer membrane autotransporter protein
MFGSKTLKAALTGTTALIGVAMLMAPTSASAAPINGNVHGTHNMGAGEALVIGNLGDVATGAQTGITIQGVTATSIANNGTIGGTGGNTIGILVQSAGAIGGDISGGVDNHGTIFGGGTGGAIVIEQSSNISGGINNESDGLIDGSGVGIRVKGFSVLTGLISNAGHITVTGTAIQAASFSNLQGGIHNTGTINGSVVGIAVDTLSNISGGITNAAGKTIHGGSTAILVQDSDISGLIDNSGTVSGGKFGIHVQSTGNISGGIKNETTGVISGSTAGIKVNGGGSDISGGVDNFGHITGTGTGLGIEVAAGGNISGGIHNEAGAFIHGGSTGILLTGSSSSISGLVQNAGTISGGSKGIQVSGGNIGGGLENDTTGIISGFVAGILVTGTAAHINGAINNFGQITGTGGGGVGIEVSAGGGIGGTISNNVTVVNHVVTATGTITGGNTGILVTGAGSAIGGGIHNFGIIQDANQYGIKVAAGGVITTIDNAVTVDNNPDAQHQVLLAHGQIIGNTAGIDVNGAGSNINGNGVTNEGTISGDDGITVQSGGDISGGITNNVTTGTVNNVAGTLLFTGNINGTSRAGVFVTGTGSNISGGIDNFGNITGNEWGINASAGGHISGLIHNQQNALISGLHTGILATGAGTALGGGVTNAGSIRGDDLGINAAAGASIASVTNTVTGHIFGGSAGINITGAGSVINAINNAGTISGTTAINIGAGAGAGEINNTGTIGGNIGIKVAATGTITGGAGSSSNAILVNGPAGFINGGINNSGTIRSGGQAISVTGGGTINSGITNTATGVIHGTSATGTGINVSGAGSAINGGITNVGTIEGGAGVGDGIKVGAGAFIHGGIADTGLIQGGTFGINNAGTIGGTSASTGVRVTGAGTISGIHNTGTIQGDTNGIFVGGGGGANISGVGIDNFGTIRGGANGILVSNAHISGGITDEAGGIIDPVAGNAINLIGLTASTPITINGGSTDGTNTNDALIIGNVIDDTPGNGFSPVTVNDDFITQGNFSVSSMEVTAGTLTISGTNSITANTFTADNGSTVKFALNNNAVFGNIHVTNGATTLTGATIKVKVNNDSTLTDGKQLRIIEGDTVNNVVGAPVNGTLVADNSYVWNFSVLGGAAASTPTNNTDLFLQAILAHPIIATPGNQNDFVVLESLTGIGGNLGTILGNVNSAGSQQAVSNILTSTEPTIDGSDAQGSETVSDTTDTFEGTRLASLRTGEDETTGMSAGNMGYGVGAWGQAFGQYTDQGERDHIPGYTASTWGAALGVDTRNISDRAIFGVAFSYGHTNASSDNTNHTDTNVDNYQASLYGDYDFDHDTYVNGMVGYTWGNVDDTRHNVGAIPGVTAHGRYDTQQISAQAEAGRDYAMSGGMTLTPNVVAHWADFDPNSYTETGAGNADLHVNGKTLNMFELGGGVKAGWAFKNSDGTWLKPQLHAGYRYALVDDQIVDTAQFVGGGGAFSVPGPTPARSTVNLGASLKFLTTRNWTFTANYDFDWKDNYTSNAGFLRAGYKF